MKTIDARKLRTEVHQHNRNQAIRLFQAGKARREIAEIVGVHYGVVCRWIRAWRTEGKKGLEIKKRGRDTGQQRVLSPGQEKELKKLLCEKNPRQMKLPFALWNRKAIQSVIYKLWRVRIAIRTIGDYMRRWGFTPQKPIKKAYEQSSKAVQEWLDHTYPDIQKIAKKENAEIYWGDETGVRNDCQHSRGYAPRGQTPVVEINAKRFAVNMVSAINNQGLLRFMIYESNMNARVLIKFMRRLIKDAGRKVFLILDNLKVHHAKIVKAWLERHQDKIEVFYLPSYSPELNPDEYLNCDLKTGIRSSSPARNQKELKGKILSHMRMLQKRADRIQKYFKHPSIKYAA
jgi:transposase